MHDATKFNMMHDDPPAALSRQIAVSVRSEYASHGVQFTLDRDRSLPCSTLLLLRQCDEHLQYQAQAVQTASVHHPRGSRRGRVVLVRAQAIDTIGTCYYEGRSMAWRRYLEQGS